MVTRLKAPPIGARSAKTSLSYGMIRRSGISCTMPDYDSPKETKRGSFLVCWLSLNLNIAHPFLSLLGLGILVLCCAAVHMYGGASALRISQYIHRAGRGSKHACTFHTGQDVGAFGLPPLRRGNHCRSLSYGFQPVQRRRSEGMSHPYSTIYSRNSGHQGERAIRRVDQLYVPRLPVAWHDLLLGDEDLSTISTPFTSLLESVLISGRRRDVLTGEHFNPWWHDM
ncbi:hypothetical protein C8Q80DRAFT_487387 [Daedaleopsis nitida]|nr:hypothetical protein C8Q80DRAFT_487387 [Daedaleopsis nitida]